MSRVFDVADTVGIFPAQFIVLEGFGTVAQFFVIEIVQPIYFTQMLPRLHLFGRAGGPCQIFLRGSHIPFAHVDTRQGYAGLDPMPAVLAFLHQIIGAPVFPDGIVPLLVLLQQIAEIGMAQGDPEVGTCRLIVLHGTTIVNPGRVDHSLLFEDCADIGIIDRLTQVTFQLPLPGQRLTECEDGRIVVLHRQLHIPYAIERNHSIF